MGNNWLLKTEPETYSFGQLLVEKRTNWNGVRNFQARNFLKNSQIGDRVLIYHSGDQKAVVGMAKVIREAYPDPDLIKPGQWFQIDIEVIQPLKSPIHLHELKKNKSLSRLLLFKNPRLSVIPLEKNDFETILKMSGETLR